MDFTKCVTLVGALLLLGISLPSEACRCVRVEHPQWHYCRSEVGAANTFRNRKQRIEFRMKDHSKPAEDFWKGKRKSGNPEVIKATFLKPSERALKSDMNEEGIGYDSQTMEVLRGDQEFQSSTYIDSYMANSSCPYSHPEDRFGILHIVGGDDVNGNVGVWSCGYVRPLSELTPKQIIGVERAYKDGCGKCEIIDCHFGCAPRKNACILQEEGGVDFEKQQNQACLLIKDTCAWTTFQ